jgi:hypothetical protein
VRAILANPRYTGRQVWNRQRTDSDLVDPANTGLGHRPVQRWNLPEGWVISARPAHPAFVTEADFIAALAICAITAALLRDRTDTQAPPPVRPDQPPPLDPGMIPLTVPEVSRLLAAVLARPSPPGHADHWSGWTRRHQARSR